MDREVPPRPVLRLLGCLCFACFVLAWRGPVWLTALEPHSYSRGNFLADFFQEWASARNYYGGLPIYTRLDETITLYLGEHKASDDITFNDVNAHPPPSILLGLPLGNLNYATAFVLWNGICLTLLGASIWLALSTLGMSAGPRVGLLILTTLLFCHPLLSQVQQGQLSIPIVFLVTLCWVLERKNKPWLSGAVLGIATALKLFPGFLFLPFLLRRRWQVLLAGAVSFAGLSILTLSVLDLDTYRAYFGDVLPTIAKYRGACHNLSVCGVWYKLFVPLPHWMPVDFVPAVPHPFAAACAYLASAGLVVFLLSRTVLRSPNDVNLSLSGSILAMLLVSPITWDHYLLVLLLPIGVLWRRLPRWGIAWPAFLFFVALLFIEPLLVMEHCLILVGASHSAQTGHWLATPLETLTALSVPCYAMVGLFVLLIFSAQRSTPARRKHALLSNLTVHHRGDPNSIAGNDNERKQEDRYG